jgi:hypothetical protein
MAFKSGSVSFRRFKVVGQVPAQPDELTLNRLADHAIRTTENSTEEVEYGWNGGRHVLDTEFTFENNVFNEALLFGLQIDTNKVPGELKRAYKAMEEEAAAKQNPSGFLSKAQKKQCKEIVEQKVEDELRSGKHRRSKVVQILWDMPRGIVYTAAPANAMAKIYEIFERTFKAELQPISSGTIADALLTSLGRRREYEDLRPTAFVASVEDEKANPEYPWISKGPQPKDFLGDEFLLWLLYRGETSDGSIDINQTGTVVKTVTYLFDKSIDLECCYGQTGRSSARGNGPARSPEAKESLRRGKVPRKAYLIVHAKGTQFEFNLNPETMQFGSARLPEVEDAETPRVLFDERIKALALLNEIVEVMFKEFVLHRTSQSWGLELEDIRRWTNKEAA